MTKQLNYQTTSIFIEAESFENIGGWVIDQQFMDVMGSPFLLAHGLGTPVSNATTPARFPQIGKYHVYVRTRDWIAPYGPGKFRVLVDNNELPMDFGTDCAGEWHWQYGGVVSIDQLNVTVQLKDMTGFDGRCDAIYFSLDKTPPPNDASLDDFRTAALGFPNVAEPAGSYDVVVIGGGIAGCCTAVQAARLGLKVALIQDRSVVGGNNSSEIRVSMQGEICKPPFVNLGNIIKEFDPGTTDYIQPVENYKDAMKLAIVKAEPNITLFMQAHAYSLEMNKNTICAVITRDVVSGKRLRFTGEFFVDCTGDATIGYLAGADYMLGRETRVQFGEPLAPDVPEMYHMGSSNLWRAQDTGEQSTFTPCPGALHFSGPYGATEGTWDWEAGFYRDPITEAEFIRDHNFRAIYGVWASEKTKPERATWKLTLLNYLAGKRESRRLIGDFVLTETMCRDEHMEPDSLIKCTWGMDDHFPADSPSTCSMPVAPKGTTAPCESFRSTFTNNGGFPLIPYRCLYSRAITNLFMAGRNISTTRIAMGTTRVMRICGMMGEVVGAAAFLCKKYKVGPRGVYEKHLEELRRMFL